MATRLLIVLSVVVAVALAGCEKPAQEQQRTTNAQVGVELLFEHDGCRIYRFWDVGHPRYFARCERASGHVESTRSVLVGKTVVRYPDTLAQDHAK